MFVGWKATLLWLVVGMLVYMFLNQQVTKIAEQTVYEQIQAQIPEGCRIGDWKFKRTDMMGFWFGGLIACPDYPPPYDTIYFEGTVECHLTTKKPFVVCESNVQTSPPIPTTTS